MCQGAKREPREQISNITSYIDGSMIYGSTDFVAGQVRDGDCKSLTMLQYSIYIYNIYIYIYINIYIKYLLKYLNHIEAR